MAITANTDISQLSPEDVIRTFAPASTTQGVSKALDIAATMRQQPSSIQVNVPDRVKSTDLTENVTTQDVMNERARMEAQQTAQITDAQSLQAALIAARGNPESADPLAGLVFPQLSPAQLQQEQALTEQRNFLTQARDFFSTRERDSVGRLESLRNQSGVPELESRIAESRERVAALQGELIKVRPQIESEAGQTRVGAEARLSPVERNLRAEIASEALVQSALVGNLEAVSNNINKILELEFQDEAFEIQNLQAQIDASAAIAATYEPAARREAEQRLQAFQLIANERENALQQRQQMKQTAIQMALQAQQNGAPSDLVSQAIRSGTPDQAATILGGYLVDETEMLNRQLIGERIRSEQQSRLIELAGAGNPKALAALGLSGQSTAPSISQKEANSLQSEITKSGAYEALQASSDSVTALKEYEKKFNEYGVTGSLSPFDNEQLKTSYNTAVLNLKEFFNLGVLNGPDLEIIQAVLGNPTDVSAFKSIGTLGIYAMAKARGAEAGLENMYKQIESSLDDRYLDIRSQYGEYGEQLPILKEVDRMYLENKAKVNPNVAAFLEDNENMPLEEKIQVINTKF